MKKWICFIVVLFLTVLCGCSRGTEVIRNDQYSIVEHKGEYALRLHDPAAYYSSKNYGDICGLEVVQTIKFASVAKMKQTIVSGSFSTQSLTIMQSTFAKSRIGGIKICNPNQLYEATLPEGMSAGTVSWFGDSYIFSLGDSGSLNYTDKEGHDEYAKRNDIESGKATILSVTTIDERNARVVEYESLMGAPRKRITYTHTSGGKTITVAETYRLDERGTAPYSIDFWGNCDGAYFTGYLYGFTERPSYEWVTSFGLKPYVETETE